MFNQFSVSMYQMCSAGQLQKFFKSLMLFKLQLYLGVVSLGYSPLLPGVPYRCTSTYVPRTLVYQMYIVTGCQSGRSQIVVLRTGLRTYCLCLYAFYVETCYLMLCVPCPWDLRVKVI